MKFSVYTERRGPLRYRWTVEPKFPFTINSHGWAPTRAGALKRGRRKARRLAKRALTRCMWDVEL